MFTGYLAIGFSTTVWAGSLLSEFSTSFLLLGGEHCLRLFTPASSIPWHVPEATWGLGTEAGFRASLLPSSPSAWLISRSSDFLRLETFLGVPSESAVPASLCALGD